MHRIQSSMSNPTILRANKLSSQVVDKSFMIVIENKFLGIQTLTTRSQGITNFQKILVVCALLRISRVKRGVFNSYLEHYQGVADLGLYFVIGHNEYGKQVEKELLPGGKSILVTHENVMEYINLTADHRLNYQIRQQSSHFLRGFQQLIKKYWIDMFNEQELQLLISGSMEGFDVKDLRAHTNYVGGYRGFVTGCSRGPSLGFKDLEPRFCIQRADGNASKEALDRLPTSATCMNVLKLPPYESKEQLEQKLLYAINVDAGFDLR